MKEKYYRYYFVNINNTIIFSINNRRKKIYKINMSNYSTLTSYENLKIQLKVSLFKEDEKEFDFSELDKVSYSDLESEVDKPEIYFSDSDENDSLLNLTIDSEIIIFEKEDPFSKLQPKAEGLQN